MLAKVVVQLPYVINIPEGETFDIFGIQVDDYEIRFYPLLRSEDAYKLTNVEHLTMNSKTAYNADTLQINFYKPDFDRKKTGDWDPPLELITKVANDFLHKIRVVTGGFRVKPINLSRTNYWIRYLNEDETELEKMEGFIRGRGSKKIQFSVIGVNNQVWNDIHKLNPSLDLPAWKTLLLDANSVLPDVGPAIILTFTALEVFISKTLDDIAQIKKIDASFWNWINDRGFFLKNPSIEEQYAFLSNHLIGKSIKEDSKLWQAFKNIQAVRNSFAHTGVATLGGKAVDEMQVLEFIKSAYEITEYVKRQLPEELRWREFKYDIKFEGVMPVFEPPSNKQ